MIKKTSSHIHIKKNPPKKSSPTNKKKGKKRAENHTLKTASEGKRKKTKSKIKSQDYETFF